MPCNSDYMKADGYEVAMSEVYSLLDELDGKPYVNHRGYDKRVYNRGRRPEHDKAVATLCARLAQVDVTKYSLEMQMWWRDHKRADALREERDRAASKAEQRRSKALAKLTPLEREDLGIE